MVNIAFWLLFMLRMIRIAINGFGALLYQAWKRIPVGSMFNSLDCSVIVPIYDINNPELEACIRSILNNYPRAVYFVTVGPGRRWRLNNLIAKLRDEYLQTLLHVGAIPFSSKRHQLIHAIPEINSRITILTDDGAFWPDNFLPNALAPFEDPLVGGVGTNKRIRRHALGFSWESFRCFLADVYYESINYENRAVNAIDGSMSVISGETALYRTEILKDRAFLDAFQKEKLFNKFGPLKNGDDNFITQWLITHDWKLAYQNTGDDCISISLHSNTDFIHHCERRARGKWRANLNAFTLPQMWKKYPYGLFSIHLSGLISFALYSRLIGVLFAAMPVIFRTPKDIVFIPALFIMGYSHTFVKMKSLFQMADTRWAPGSTLSSEEAIIGSQEAWIWGYQLELRNWYI
ncbi:hypothetical protein BGZ63DRAFT_410490 [Mariannaea sp. PMI_226]|nr:hypothetical protein BGZ63DRAFT_410490 [Mariannaea sp. PMI_226]